MPAPTDLPVVSFATPGDFATWLATHHASAKGALLQLTKKGVEPRSITYAEALDVALAWGWIDAQKFALDERSWLQRFGPRTKRSPWSQINREKIAALLEAGKMQPSGMLEVERARADGRWERAYPPASRAEVPDDLAVALAANPEAQVFFATLKGASRYAVLYRIESVKKAETRARKIAQLVEMLARKEAIHG